ncbi:MAG: hypothetical protein GKC53_04220 [Neisseriaceae bacterium]|nr:MAG: hypothetical protein GKC53_04220 [Neisseriaceae bacterium]
MAQVKDFNFMNENTAQIRISAVVLPKTPTIEEYKEIESEETSLVEVKFKIYCGNIMKKGFVETQSNNEVRETAEKVVDVLPFLTFGRLKYLVLIAKLRSLVGVYILAVLTIPQIGTNLIMEYLGRKL